MKNEYYRRRDPKLSYDLDERQEANIVKSYPSISYATDCPHWVVGFDKLDGSNVRAEWTRKKGFHKFGTRTRLVDASDPLFGQVPGLILEKYGDSLSSIASHEKWDRAMFFL